MNLPLLIEGGLAVDDRGELRFVNDFDFSNIKRFYHISNHRQGFVRAWHAHKKESKYAFCILGAVILGIVPIDNWDQPNKSILPQRFVLSENKPAILYIPAGYANGFMSLTADSSLIMFSTSTLDESKNDDFRYDAHYWDIWQVEER
jgi:dTDP-4-dehydrorhamnose 3,5-epimerase-like enzyme